MSASTSKFEILTTVSGETSIRHMGIEETIHPAGPVFEAHVTYIEQSLLEHKLQESLKFPLVLFDVGFGAAGNTSQVLDIWDGLEEKRDLEIYSFENDLSLLEFTLKNISLFPHLLAHEGRLKTLLKNHLVEEPGLKWVLLEGEFNEQIQKNLPPPELIFHDAYSPSKNPEMWRYEIFKRYSQLIEPLKDKTSTILLTFSQANHVRASFLAAGFYVGEGNELGFNRRSTVASTTLSDLTRPLPNEWLAKYLRCPDAKTPRFALELLTAHIQFKDNV